MLWNVVYEFFVKYIFGGRLAGGTYSGVLGLSMRNGTLTNTATSDLIVDFFGSSWSFGNYFSFIATIISMVVIVVLCCMLIKKIYNICAHIIG